MVYTSPQQVEIPEAVSLPLLLHPSVVAAARQIYRAYYDAHPDRAQQPLGVAINQYTFRGKLIMSRKPILLPEECFVPFEVLSAEVA